MAPAILTRGLKKVYRVFQKEPGFGGALRGLFHRRYQEVSAVAGVDLEIAPGELVGFLGPNGAGSVLRKSQTGFARSYAAFILIGAIALIAGIWVVTQ